MFFEKKRYDVDQFQKYGFCDKASIFQKSLFRRGELYIAKGRERKGRGLDYHLERK